jgi:uncharacterized protein (DUF1697 family)
MPIQSHSSNEEKVPVEPMDETNDSRKDMDYRDVTHERTTTPVPISPRTPKEETKKKEVAPLFLFDWDDTLLASSYLRGKGYRLDAEFQRTPEVEEGLRELEQSILDVLNTAMQLGNIVIVTNAENGWVQMSAQKFVPAAWPLLSKLKIISARSTYEQTHPNDPVQWKFCAFQENVQSAFGAESKVVKHVVSFGDSQVEREAVRAVTRSVTSCRTKSVKFAESPSLRELVRELQLVTNCMTYVVTHDGDLDLQLSITINA